MVLSSNFNVQKGWNSRLRPVYRGYGGIAYSHIHRYGSRNVAVQYKGMCEMKAHEKKCQGILTK